ncbi:MAG: hypothetical protein E7342_03440 [Clostridiales bacterium]|nr:hypothetical protein [Clostridiales bacterium]
MRRETAMVLDVGSLKITSLIGERGVNKTFIVRGQKDFEYEGFCDGEFFDVNSLELAIEKSVENLVQNAGQKVKTVFVGVPAEFTTVIQKDYQIALQKRRKITEEDVNRLFDESFSTNLDSYTLINRSSILFELDDFRRFADPVGEVSETLKGRLSFVLCKNYFIDKITPKLKSMGIDNIEYVSANLAQGLFLVEPETRDRVAILIDVGYISSSFSIIQGDGLVYQRAFSYGGGYITANLSEEFGVDFDIAESLKRKINICLDNSDDDNYEIINGEEGYYFIANKVNEIAVEALDNICAEIEKSVISSKFNIPSHIPVYVTGGGISYIRGAKEHIAKRISMNVEVIGPKVPLYNKPTNSSCLSVLDLALSQVSKR